MHLKNRVLAITAVVVMAVFAVYGSTKEISEKKVVETSVLPTDQKKTIYFGYSDDALSSYVSSAAVAFGDKEDVRVIPVLLEENNYLENIHRMTIEEKQFPDAYILANDFLEKAYLAGLAEKIEDVAGVCNEDTFPLTALQATTYQGKEVAYPFFYETSVMIYNKDYLGQWVAQQSAKEEEPKIEEELSETSEEAEDEEIEDESEEEISLVGQISEEGVPYTMEALLHIADTFDVPDGVEGIMEWDVSDILYNYWFVGNYLVVGGECGDDSSRIDINNPQTEECLEFYKSLHQFFSIETAEISYESCIQDFIDGKIVFTMGNTRTVQALEEAKASGAMKQDYGFFVMPQISTQLQSKNMSVTYAVAVNGYSQEKELANQFAAYLTDEYIEELYDRTGKYCANKKLPGKSEAKEIFDAAYAESVSLPKLMEIGNLWLQLETMFAKIWNGEEVLPLLEELTGLIESQLIMR